MYFESATGYTLSAFVFVVGGCIAVLAGKHLTIKPLMSVAIYVWHTVFGLALYAYVLANGGDTLAYFQRAKFEYISLAFGTEFIVWLAAIPVKLGFSFLATNLLFSIIGAIGLLFFYASLRNAAGNIRDGWLGGTLVLVCTFMPSASFWTGVIGKDSLALLAVGFFVWALGRLDRRLLLLIPAITIMFLVRPHMAALMIVSVVLGTLFIPRLVGVMRLSLGVAALVAASIAVPFGLAYAGTGAFIDLRSYVEDRQGMYVESGSGIDLEAMNPVLRVLSYIYRPLPHEASGLDQMASSVENLILIMLTVIALIGITKAGFLNVFRQYAVHWIYGVGGLLILSQVTGNLGLAARQKWMILPPLMIVTVAAWNLARERQAASRRKVAVQMDSFQAAR